jgi:hypothetical protein
VPGSGDFEVPALIAHAAHAQAPAQMRPGVEVPDAAATIIIHNTELAGWNVSQAPEHSGQLVIFLSIPLVNQEWNGIMSDPRYSDRSDQSRRYGARGSNGAGGFWPWLTAALTALGTLIGLLIGYNWADHRTAQLSPPATTGSAPLQPRTNP